MIVIFVITCAGKIVHTTSDPGEAFFWTCFPGYRAEIADLL